jgi:O-antigen ligase
MKFFLNRWAFFVLSFGCMGLLFLMRPTTWLPTLVILLASILLLIDSEFRCRFIGLFCRLGFGWIAWPFLIWLIVSLFVTTTHAFNSNFYFPENELRVCLALTVLCFGVRQNSKAAFAYGLVIGACAAAIWGVYGMQVEHMRAQGTTNNPIHFGNLTAMGALFCASIGLLAKDLDIKFRMLMLMGAILYLVASITSLTRSSTVLVLCALPLFWLPQKDLFYKWTLNTFVVLLMACAFLVATSSSVQERLRIHQITAAINSSQNIDYERLTSDRANMWHAAVLIVQKHPWLGVGPIGFSSEFQALIEEGRVQKTLVHNQPHNDILYAASTGGIVKLLAYILLICGPFIYFYKQYKARTLLANRVYSVLGMQLVGAFFLTGLTNSNFDLQIYSTTYAVLICVLAKLSSLDDSAAINAAEPSKPSTPATPSC